MKVTKPLDHHGSEQLIVSESAASDQDALTAIDVICGDDFCEDMNCRDALGHEFDGQPDLQTAIQKLVKIYRIAHGFVRSHSCYHAHGAWRSEVPPILAALTESASDIPQGADEHDPEQVVVNGGSKGENL